MGSKRKRSRTDSHIRKKIRRLQQQLRNSSDESSGDDGEYERYYPDSPSPRRTHSQNFDDDLYIDEDTDGSLRSLKLKSCLGLDYNDAGTSQVAKTSAESRPNTADDLPVAGPSTSTDIPTLSADILEALGDPKGKEEMFGPKIPEEIAKRWGRVLVDGLSKEQRQELLEKTLFPENFRLAKAPLLNDEIIPVLSEAARNRDKLLEKSQNQLGLGISSLTNIATLVIEGNTDKIELLKRISETSQIFLDLHFEDTRRRRKLITSSLDKRFISMITDIKRDEFLFGANLGEKIKASKTAERSGLQIKRNETATSSQKYPQQGNWRGPLRSQGYRTYKQSGPRNRYPTQTNRRPPPTADRQPRFPTKTPPIKNRKTQ